VEKPVVGILTVTIMPTTIKTTYVRQPILNTMCAIKIGVSLKYETIPQNYTYSTMMDVTSYHSYVTFKAMNSAEHYRQYQINI
jgi:hypothetical protein